MNIDLKSDSFIQLSFSDFNGTEVSIHDINQIYFITSDSTLTLTDSIFERNSEEDLYDFEDIDFMTFEYVRSCIVS